MIALSRKLLALVSSAAILLTSPGLAGYEAAARGVERSAAQESRQTVPAVGGSLGGVAALPRSIVPISGGAQLRGINGAVRPPAAEIFLPEPALRPEIISPERTPPAAATEEAAAGGASQVKPIFRSLTNAQVPARAGVGQSLGKQRKTYDGEDAAPASGEDEVSVQQLAPARKPGTAKLGPRANSGGTSQVSKVPAVSRMNSSLVLAPALTVAALGVLAAHGAAVSLPLALGLYVAHKAALFFSAAAHEAGHLAADGQFVGMRFPERIKLSISALHLQDSFKRIGQTAADFAARHPVLSGLAVFLAGADTMNAYVRPANIEPAKLKRSALAGPLVNAALLSLGVALHLAAPALALVGLPIILANAALLAANAFLGTDFRVLRKGETADGLLRLPGGQGSTQEGALAEGPIQPQTPQATFLEKVIIPVSGTLGGSVQISAATHAEGFPVLLVRHRAEYLGKTYDLSYRIEFIGKAVATPKLASLSQTNVIRVPAGALEGAVLADAQNAWRRMTVGDPLLNRRFTSKIIEATPYQEEAVEATVASLHAHKHALDVMATGTGKTFVAFKSIFRYVDELPKREHGGDGKRGVILFMVNNRMILGEAEGKLGEYFPGKHKAGRIYDQVSDYGPDTDIIFVTPTSLTSRGRIEDLLKGRKIAAVIVDEVHHLPAATNRLLFNRIYEESEAKGWNTAFLGFTATETRPDRASVLSFFGNDITYEYPIGRGWEEGYLTPMVYQEGDQDIFKELGIDPKKARRLEPGTELYEQYKALMYDKKRYPRLLDLYHEYAAPLADKRGLILAPDIDSSQALARYFSDGRRGKKRVEAISLTSRDREENPLWFEHAYEAWKRGAWPKDSPFKDRSVPQVVVAVDIFREGTDVPGISVIINWADTDSSIRFIQGIGRGLRPSPFKTNLVVVDTVGLFRKVHLLRYLGGLLQGQARKKGLGAKRRMGDDDLDLDRERQETGTIFGRDVAEVIEDYLADIPGMLEDRYGTYPNIPAKQYRALDGYIAVQAGFYVSDSNYKPDEAALHAYFQEMGKRLVHGASEDEIAAFREKFFFTFGSIGLSEEDAQINQHSDIPLTGASQIVFSRFAALLQRNLPSGFGPEQAYEFAYKVFPEFHENWHEIFKKRAANLKILRKVAFGNRHDKLVMRTLLTERSRKLNSFSGGFKDFISLAHKDDGDEREEHSFIYAAEGGKYNQDLFDYEKGRVAVSEKYRTDTGRYWQDHVVQLYLLNPKIEGKLARESFDLSAADFRALLISQGLAQNMTGLELLSRTLRQRLEEYAAAAESAEGLPMAREALKKVVEEGAETFASMATELSEGRCSGLLNLWEALAQAQAKLGAKATEMDGQIKAAFDSLLERAGLRKVFELPELHGVKIVVERLTGVRNYRFSIVPAGAQNPFAEEHPRLYVSLRDDYLGKTHAYILSQTDRSLSPEMARVQNFFSSLNAPKQAAFAAGMKDALSYLAEIFGDDMVYVVPKDGEDGGLFAAVFEELLDGGAYVLGPIEKVETQPDKDDMKFSYSMTERSRIPVDADAVRYLRSVIKKGEYRTHRDVLAYIYINWYEYLQNLLPRSEDVYRRLAAYPEAGPARAAADFLRQRIERIMKKDILSPSTLETLKLIFELLQEGQAAGAPTEAAIDQAVLKFVSGDYVESNYRARDDIRRMIEAYFRFRADIRNSGKPLPEAIAKKIPEFGVFARFCVDSYLKTKDFPQYLPDQGEGKTTVQETAKSWEKKWEQWDRVLITNPNGFAATVNVFESSDAEALPLFDSNGEARLWYDEDAKVYHWNPKCPRAVDNDAKEVSLREMQGKRATPCSICKPPKLEALKSLKPRPGAESAAPAPAVVPEVKPAVHTVMAAAIAAPAAAAPAQPGAQAKPQRADLVLDEKGRYLVLFATRKSKKADAIVHMNPKCPEIKGSVEEVRSDEVGMLGKYHLCKLCPAVVPGRATGTAHFRLWDSLVGEFKAQALRLGKDIQVVEGKIIINP